MGNPRLLVVVSIVMLSAFVVWLGFRFAAAFLAPELAHADAAINQFVQDMRTDVLIRSWSASRCSETASC